jgi:lauroyl/myristoyl acyltransferase
MTQQTVPQPAASPASTRLERLNHLLARRDASKSEVFDLVHSLSDDELLTFGLRAYRLNLLSLFGHEWSPEKIARTARAAAINKILGGWEYHHQYLPRLTQEPDAPQLAGALVEQVRALLERGRGAVGVSFHLGHMRYLVSDLAHAGISTYLPLATDSFKDYDTARAYNPDAALWKHLHFFDVEARAGAIGLAKALARGELLFSTIDGNTGADGRRGDDRRSTVAVLGSQCRVKNGMLAMAARFGAPVIPVMAHELDGRRVCTMGPVHDPGGPLRGADAERFVEEAVQSAYTFLGETLRSYADEWCGGDLFHQWRLPAPTPNRPVEECERSLTEHLRTGGRVAMDTRRILELPGEKDIVWTDAMTGRCYKIPSAMTNLATRLADASQGVDQQWLEQHPSDERSRMWSLICQLASRDAIRCQTR